MTMCISKVRGEGREKLFGRQETLENHDEGRASFTYVEHFLGTDGSYTESKRGYLP